MLPQATYLIVTIIAFTSGVDEAASNSSNPVGVVANGAQVKYQNASIPDKSPFNTRNLAHINNNAVARTDNSKVIPEPVSVAEETDEFPENEVVVANNPVPVTTTTAKPRPEFSWVYRCNGEGGCRRESGTAAGSGTHTTLDQCKLTCGRFGALWPKPRTVALSAQTIKVHPDNFRFDLVNAPPKTRTLIAEMTSIFTGHILAECGRNRSLVSSDEGPNVVVLLTVRSENMALKWDTDESYSLDLSKSGDMVIHIHAETIFGARHGLETLSQLVAPYFKNGYCGLVMLTGAKIRDKPVYTHRGLSLDTSRSFIPLKDIMRTVDGMGANKMNVLHWHVTDSHSFPIESKRVPQMTKYGAYSASEVYSPEEVRALMKHARARGVRVVLELDAPAHAGNGWQWGREAGLGDLAVCVDREPWRAFCVQPPCGQLNAANPRVYDVLRDLYRDMLDATPPGELFHMGGDEVFMNCWNATDEIVSYLESKGLDRRPESFIRLWAEFQATALKTYDEATREIHGSEVPPAPIMLWSSLLTAPSRIENFLPKNRYIIQVWDEAESPLPVQLSNLGYRVVVSSKDVWYLDRGVWQNTKYSSWRKMYNYRLPAPALGGEVCMWTEYADHYIIDGRIWPRAAAVAERLWSDPASEARMAESRMYRQRARLVARGLRPEAVAPEWCIRNDGKCA